jgi:hypothetical protein
VRSLWEFILQHDADFHYPDYGGERMTTVSDRKGCCLLPLLHRRVTTCWSAPLSYSRTAVPI